MERGLDGAEVSARLAVHGPNVLPSLPRESAGRRLGREFAEPPVLLLLAATAVAFAAWALEGARGFPFEPAAILAIVIANGLLGFVQESRAERAMAALRALAAPRARVVRDGVPVEIDAAGVVPGDLLLLEEGDRVAADGRLLAAVALRVIESALTGDSAPADKESMVVFWYNQTTAVCGNGIREGAEICDGTDLGGDTCQTYGFDAGTLQCNASLRRCRHVPVSRLAVRQPHLRAGSRRGLSLVRVGLQRHPGWEPWQSLLLWRWSGSESGDLRGSSLQRRRKRLRVGVLFAEDA